MTKNMMNKMMVASAALALAAGVASAQSTNAEIPFAFHVAGKKLAPGKYTVKIISTNAVPVFAIHNYETREGALTTALGAQNPSKEWKKTGAPTLVFACTDDGCDLDRLWNADGRPAYVFRHAQSKRDDVRMAYIPLQVQKGE